ncbi:hypothetical protein CVD28_06885 [Bacillus sp. M6-12]|nr:hypothetical protein CVD28_06885 [Bacillus sp. M6-12]
MVKIRGFFYFMEIYEKILELAKYLYDLILLWRGAISGLKNTHNQKEANLLNSLFRFICVSLSILFFVYSLEMILDMTVSFYNLGYELGRR